ncbi:uncharacterized protein LOC135847118 [Planococcus citri]|uniref:uncharacterized protein LOC135847118 n=1 Tax=Planococcus citri TaxID=170843 RepID=UPI0031F9EA36
MLVFGLMGALRMCELHDIKVDDVQQHGDLLLVNIPSSNTKNNAKKSFVIQGKYLGLVRKYMELRPPNTNEKTDQFFIQYHEGTCSRQPIGINKLRGIPKLIAKYLSLPDAGKYTGHSFRRTSTSILANAGANAQTIKLHGGWKSDSTPNRYVNESIQHKAKTANIIASAVLGQSTHTSTEPSVPVHSDFARIEDIPYFNPDENETKDSEIENNVCNPEFIPILTPNGSDVTIDSIFNQNESGTVINDSQLSAYIVEDEYKITQSQVISDETVVQKPKKFKYKTPVLYKFKNCHVTINH